MYTNKFAYKLLKSEEMQATEINTQPRLRSAHTCKIGKIIQRTKTIALFIRT